jgi:hypothetical protein
MNALIKKGVQFAVCQMYSRGIAGRIAKTNGVETDNVVKEIAANLLRNAHTVSAGILAVDRAQGRGQSFIHLCNMTGGESAVPGLSYLTHWSLPPIERGGVPCEHST